MTNQYISTFEYHKYSGKNTVDSMLLTLEQLLRAREQKGLGQQLQNLLKIGLPVFFQRAFYQPELTQNNIKIIQSVIEQLNQLKASSDYQQEGETANTRLEILGILGENFNDLSKKSKTQEFFNYVMFHEGSIDFSMRESTIIEPSPVEIITETEEPYDDGQTWEVPEISRLLSAKDIPDDIFNLNEDELSLESPIADHAKWAFQHIYQYPYPRGFQDKVIARFHHGIQHTSRAALYACIENMAMRKLRI